MMQNRKMRIQFLILIVKTFQIAYGHPPSIARNILTNTINPPFIEDIELGHTVGTRMNEVLINKMESKSDDSVLKSNNSMVTLKEEPALDNEQSQIKNDTILSKKVNYFSINSIAVDNLNKTNRSQKYNKNTVRDKNHAFDSGENLYSRNFEYDTDESYIDYENYAGYKMYEERVESNENGYVNEGVMGISAGVDFQSGESYLDSKEKEYVVDESNDKEEEHGNKYGADSNDDEIRADIDKVFIDYIQDEIVDEDGINNNVDAESSNSKEKEFANEDRFELDYTEIGNADTSLVNFKEKDNVVEDIISNNDTGSYESKEKEYLNEDIFSVDGEESGNDEQSLINSKEKGNVAKDIIINITDEESYISKEKEYLKEDRFLVDTEEDGNDTQSLIDSKKEYVFEDKIDNDTDEYRYVSKYNGYVKDVGVWLTDGVGGDNDDLFIDPKGKGNNIEDGIVLKTDDGSFDFNERDYANYEDGYGFDVGVWFETSEDIIESKKKHKVENEVGNTKTEYNGVDIEIDDGNDADEKYVYYKNKNGADYGVANNTDKNATKLIDNQLDIAIYKAEGIGKTDPKKKTNIINYKGKSKTDNSNYGEHNYHQDYEDYEHNSNYSYSGSFIDSKENENDIGEEKLFAFDNKGYIEYNIENGADYKSIEYYIDEFLNDTVSFFDDFIRDYRYNIEQNIKDQLINNISDYLIADSSSKSTEQSHDDMLIDYISSVNYKTKHENEEDLKEFMKINEQDDEINGMNLNENYNLNRSQSVNIQENEIQGIPVLAIFRTRGHNTDILPEPLKSFLAKLTWKPYNPSSVESALGISSLQGGNNLEFPNENFLSTSLTTQASDEDFIFGDMDLGSLQVGNNLEFPIDNFLSTSLGTESFSEDFILGNTDHDKDKSSNSKELSTVINT